MTSNDSTNSYLQSNVIESALFGVTASGFEISAGTPLFPSSRPCTLKSADKRKQEDASLYPVKARYKLVPPYSLLSAGKAREMGTKGVPAEIQKPEAVTPKRADSPLWTYK